MNKQFFMFHKDHAPTGTIFDSSEVSVETLVAQGYVDNPAKVGINLWGADNQKAVQDIRDLYNAGKIPAVDDDSNFSPSDSLVAQRLQEKVDALTKELDESRRQELTTRNKLDEFNEKEKEENYEASKIAGKKSKASKVKLTNGENSKKLTGKSETNVESEATPSL